MMLSLCTKVLLHVWSYVFYDISYPLNNSDVIMINNFLLEKMRLHTEKHLKFCTARNCIIFKYVSICNAS